SPSCGTDRTASLWAVVQYGRHWPGPMVHRPEQSPLCWAFQRLLQIARSPILDRSALAQPLEPPYTDPYVRWCGRGGAEGLPPIPINGAQTEVTDAISGPRTPSAWCRVRTTQGACA